jgi:hypothetical protein
MLTDDGHLARFRMDVVCATVPEAVVHAGGLICDRSLTGWNVNVFAMREDSGDHDLALRILGAARTDPAAMAAEPAEAKLLRTVVVSGSVYPDDQDVRRWVEAAMSDPLIEVLVWDSGLPASDARQVEIPVSRAAAAFRDQAVVAAELESIATNSELYCQLRAGQIRHPLRRQHVLSTVSGG